MEQFGIIQILRALAALMVVVSHAQNDAKLQAVKLGLNFHRAYPVRWDSGVDLFFVISGFIMVHASQNLFATSRAWLIFLRRRLIRIVPLYWLFTALQLVGLAVHTSGTKIAFPHLNEILASFGFFPFARPADGAPRPISALGWTLNYEMYFYCIFAAFIWLPKMRAVAGVGVALLMMATWSAIMPASATAVVYWGDLIVLEFALGMGLALIWRSEWRLPVWASQLLMIFVGGALMFDGWLEPHSATFDVEVNGWWRLVSAGVPMALLLGALILRRTSHNTDGRLARAGRKLGDASYALYLVHPFVVTLVRKAYLMWGLPSLGFWPLVMGQVIFSIPIALLVHQWVELPLTTWLGAHLKSKAGSSHSGGASPLQPERG